MINEVTIDGIKYVAVDKKFNGDLDFSCKDCDIYKARVPQNMAQLPLCYEDEYCKVNKSCIKQAENLITRIWKKRELIMEEEFWKELKSKCSKLGIDFDGYIDKSDAQLMYNGTIFDVQCYEEEDNKLYVPLSIVCMTIRGKEYSYEDYEFVDIDFTETYDDVSDAIEEVIDAVVNSNHKRKALKVINSFESFIEDMKQDELDILLSYIKKNYEL